MRLQVPASELDTYVMFLDESMEHLETMERKVLTMGDGTDAGAVHEIFRAVHSIKGVASFLGLADIQKLSHKLESVFELIRQGKIGMDESLLRTCLENLDRLQSMLANLRAGIDCRSQGEGHVWEVDVEEFDCGQGLRDLERILLGEAAADQAPEAGDSLITPEMAAAFIKEGEETLDAVEQIFLRLSADPADADALGEAFRGIHSFKGNAGFFGYADLEKVSHRLESMLQPVRDGGGPAPRAAIELTLACLDALRTAVAGLGSGKQPEVPGREALCARLDALIAGPAAAPPAPAPRLGEILIEQGQASAEGVALALELQNRPLGRILVEEGLASKEAVEDALSRQGGPGPAKTPGSSPAPGPAKEGKRDLRVDLSKLDLLLDLVGELVISTGMVFNHPLLRDSGAADLERTAHHLKGVVGELQNVALGVRMIPVEGPFRKMTRLVHDLSAKSGKKVKLEFKGEETEIDKNVADLISDPLVHMIRNAIDHGLEAGEERAATGKDPIATILLEAAQEGGEILISVRDDGRGMNRGRILAKAREKGMIEGDGSDLKDEDVFQFIFAPGFSTAEAVTATSGRGVGMDVVKSNIERIGGRITIRSAPGKGSTIVLRIPLTLSIIEGMMVRSGRSLFTLPLLAVKESISPRKEHLTRLAGGQEILLLRGKVLPVVRLHKVHNLEADKQRLEDGLLISLETRGEAYCLFVDELIGQRQTVVKALPGYLGKVAGVSSCSILDSGDISLILDVAGVYEKHRQTEGIL